jgi:hypothetical protein
MELRHCERSMAISYNGIDKLKIAASLRSSQRRVNLNFIMIFYLYTLRGRGYIEL